jgi:hypothetical protein
MMSSTVTCFTFLLYALWVSNMQTQIAIITTETEYIALHQSMRDLIPIREILKEIKPECTTHSKAFQDGAPLPNEIIPQSEVFEDNAACMKFAHMPKIPPHTKHLEVPPLWYISKVINLEIIIRSVESAKPFERSRMSLMGW